MSENQRFPSDPADSGRARPEAWTGEEISLVDAVTVIFRRRRLVFWTCVIGVLVSILVALFTPPSYIATTRIIPSALLATSSDLSGFSALRGAVSQLGLSIGGGNGSSAILIPDMIASRDLVSNLFSRSYPTRNGGTTDLISYFHVKESNPERKLARAVYKYGRKILRTSYDLKTGVTTISADFRDPVLAAAVVNASTDELNRYMQNLRTSQAGEKVRFISNRLAEVQDSLSSAENALESFQERNRVFTGSPELTLQQNRLARRVTVNEQLFLTLKSQYEIARIEELRNLPDALVIEKGAVPLVRSSPRRVRFVILGGIASAVISLGLVAAVEAVTGFRRKLRAA